MTRLSISEVRSNLAQTVKTAANHIVVLEKHGKDVAVLMGVEKYNELMNAYEEVQDIGAFDDAMADLSPNIPWESVKKDLGRL